MRLSAVRIVFDFPVERERESSGCHGCHVLFHYLREITDDDGDSIVADGVIAILFYKLLLSEVIFYFSISPFSFATARNSFQNQQMIIVLKNLNGKILCAEINFVAKSFFYSLFTVVKARRFFRDDEESLFADTNCCCPCIYVRSSSSHSQ